MMVRDQRSGLTSKGGTGVTLPPAASLTLNMME